MADQLLKPGDMCKLYTARAYAEYADAEAHSDGSFASSLDGDVKLSPTQARSPVLIVAVTGGIAGFLPTGSDGLVWLETKYLGLPR